MTVWRGFVAAVQLLTRIPVPSPPQAPDPRTLGWAAVFFPLVGAGLGWAGWWSYAGARRLVPPEIAALLVLGLWAFLTGALHEDGLADTADAFGSQSTKEGLLRVLKDSRIGTYGAIALILVYAVRWQCLIRLSHALPFVMAQMLPRAAIVAAALWAGPAASGTGSAFAAAVRWPHLAGSLAVCAAIQYAAFAWPLEVIAQPWIAAFAVSAVCAAYFRRRLGGVTGDCLGAAAVLSECAVLLVLLRLTGT